MGIDKHIGSALKNLSEEEKLELKNKAKEMGYKDIAKQTASEAFSPFRNIYNKLKATLKSKPEKEQVVPEQKSKSEKEIEEITPEINNENKKEGENEMPEEIKVALREMGFTDDKTKDMTPDDVEKIFENRNTVSGQNEIKEGATTIHIYKPENKNNGQKNSEQEPAPAPAKPEKKSLEQKLIETVNAIKNIEAEEEKLADEKVEALKNKDSAKVLDIDKLRGEAREERIKLKTKLENLEKDYEREFPKQKTNEPKKQEPAPANPNPTNQAPGNIPPAPANSPQAPGNSPETEATLLAKVEKARQEYFNAKNNKALKKEDPEAYEEALNAKRDAYNSAKDGYTGHLTGQSKNEKAKEFIFEEVEKVHKDNLDNGSLPEKIKTGVTNGIKYWGEIGLNPDGTNQKGFGGWAKRTAKIALNIGLIGLTSMYSAQKASEMGVHYADTILKQGVGSSLKNRLLMGLGMSTVMGGLLGKVSEKYRGVASTVLGLTVSGGMALFLGGGIMAAGVAVGAGAVGYGVSKMISKKWSERAIKEKEKNAKKGTLDKNKVAESSRKLEEEYMKALKGAENSRLKRALIGGAFAITAGVGTIELAGAIHDNYGTEFAKGMDDRSGGGGTLPEGPVDNNFDGAKVILGNGEGGIQAILNLKAELRHDYNDDFSHAPKSVQDFMNDHHNATRVAMETGLFDPKDATGEESAMLKAGDTLEMDSAGNLHLRHAGEDLIGDDHKYHGKMFDSDHSVEKNDGGDGTVTDEPDNKIHSEDPNAVNTKDQLSTPPVDEVKKDEFDFAKQNDKDMQSQTPRETPNENANNTADNTKVNHTLYELTAEQLTIVNNTHYLNISHLFSGSMSSWEGIKDQSAEKYFNTEDFPLNEKSHPYISYLHNLEEQTGLEPRSEGGIPWQPAETTDEYIVHALQKAEAMGILDKVKL